MIAPVVLNYFCRLNAIYQFSAGVFMPRQMESRLPRVSLGFIMIANDHYKTEALQSKPSKTLDVFDGFDFLLERLHPLYKMPSIQRARKDELYKVAEVRFSLNNCY